MPLQEDQFIDVQTEELKYSNTQNVTGTNGKNES